MAEPQIATPEIAGLSILTKARREDIRMHPYPHLVIHDALPTDLYATLEAGFPTLEEVAGDEIGKNNRATQKTAEQTLADPNVIDEWKAFFRYHTSRDFYLEFLELWAPTLETMYPNIKRDFGKSLAEFSVGMRASGRDQAARNNEFDVMLENVFGINTPVREVSQVRGPHGDVSYKMFSSLLYFRDAEDDSTGGEYQLFAMKRRLFPQRLRKNIPVRYLDESSKVTVPYRANTLIHWLNGARSVHDVSPRSVTPFTRRYVAVAGECYGGPIPGGYFAQDEEWNSALGRARTWLNL